MTLLAWILASGVAMSAIALVGSVTLLLSEDALSRVLRPLVALAAGTLIGGALFHMLPEAIAGGIAPRAALVWAAAGFVVFFAIEELLHRHHCRRASADCRKPLTYLVLIGDGLHNLLGGLAVGGAFVADVRLGLTTWLVAAEHEVPQELGDFGVLVHGGWGKRRALVMNLLSALTFLVGSLLAYGLSFQADVAVLVPFAAGNFLYIGASDLVPEVRTSHTAGEAWTNLACLVAGMGLLLGIAAAA